jgi:mycothiol system anti-sigma-R factor
MTDSHTHSDDPDDPDCAAALAQLYSFLDGELTVERKVVIRGHLDHCTDCLEAYDFEAELRVVISSHCRSDAVPSELRDRILRAIEAGESEDTA